MENVHHTYLANSPHQLKALKRVNLEVTSQHIHAISGTNGSGKSTLLQHINGILRPEQGCVHVGSLALEIPDTTLKSVIEQVGLVFQSPETQFFETNVFDEIAYGPKQFNMNAIEDRVKNTMAMVGLDYAALKDRHFSTLSGGEKRKVALASTLILDQDIFLFDEPTAGMDPNSRIELLALFTDLNKNGKTLMIASHRLEELAIIAHELSIMVSGMVLRTGPCQEILSDSLNIHHAGLIPPLAVKASDELIKKNWPIAGIDTTTPERLIRVLQEMTL